MKVVIAGSSGLIGTALVAALRRDGHEVTRLVRRPAAARDELTWDPAHARVPERALRGADAVVNLCGAGIGRRRWNGSYKQELRDSRITPTDVLAGAVAAAGVPTLVNASGVHYYGGGTGDRVVTESDSAGTGFLGTLCRDWEAATRPAAEAGARVVLLRSAVVLARHGGMLSMLHPLYFLGLGGRLGNGRQYLPWISLADEIGAIQFALARDTVRGPVNMTGPAPVTNAEFSRALARTLHRPDALVVPAFALRALIGEFAQEAILHGPRAIPTVLEAAGYAFTHSTVGQALAAALGDGR
ncbi:TIGR01777 family protein [Nocardia terpenica]|uniref:Epimerase n=1 Tax=Nocardia terpenica TaxID=455432 RepID=A0A161WL63_9NOCA|nr:TIGR01777 family oxidoreductase [Nocardia terpenica]KZM73815.1 epimerase [Nocardia terpenica]MBF6064559.1 TIGR01777 family protein [Nocardia terpenica]MBF6106817.1 TIGR01777 family protein [Nocardia terpenica]MBF6114527.1 TIGR01777 family protein [Nocardia terpenica]MBF6121387.1 TIGR01777 family protein [Nocardia terpenica]